MIVIDWNQFINSGLYPESAPGQNTKEKYSSMTVGVFDGVHRGHQALIERVVLLRHNADHVPVVVTFRENHKIAGSEQLTEGSEQLAQRDIQTFQQRLEMFERLGIQIVIVIDFDEKFRRMPGIEFLEILLKRGNVGFFAVGSNFRCGNNLDTSAAVIQKFFASHDIPVEIVPEVLEGSLPISSSRVRKAIAAGDLALAESMLGRCLPEEANILCKER